MRSDEQLLDAWAGGDAPAGREFFTRWADRVTRFIGRKTAGDVADLVQRTFLKCLEARKKGATLGRTEAVLFTIARNELYDAFKRARREGEPFDPDVLSLEELRTGASSRLARHEQHRLLLLALQRLPLDDQLALELYYWEDLPMEEVARVLGCTKSSAINRVHRARGAIRRLLAELEVSPELVEATASGFETWAKSLKADEVT